MFEAVARMERENNTIRGTNHVVKRENRAQIPIQLKEGIRKSAGLAFDNAQVRYNSDLPTRPDAFGRVVQRCGLNGGGGQTGRPTWRQSEIDAAADWPGYDPQKSFIDGEEVPYGAKGSVRPDYYQDGHSVDIKNYNVESANGRRSLARNIERQYYQRTENLREGTEQSVMIDIRGQNVSDTDLSTLYDDIMERTDNGIEVLFKKS